MKHSILTVLVIGLTGVGSALAQGTPSFVVPADMPGVGLRILLPARSIEEPLPPLERRVYRFTQGERQWTEERYAVRELWLRTQLLGQWRDQHGNRMRLLRPSRRFPAGLDQYVRRSVYDEQAARMPDFSAPATKDMLAWVSDYIASSPGEVHTIKLVSHPLQAAVRVDTQSSQRLMYVMQVSDPQQGIGGNGSLYVVADLDLVASADVVRARQSFEERFLRSIALMPNTVSVSPVRTERKEGESGDRVYDAAVGRSRVEAHASVANLRNWQAVDIGDYVLLSDQRRGANQLVRDMERTLGAMHQAFAVLVPPLQPFEGVGIIRLFAEQDAYTRYVGEEYAWSAGLWSEARGELVIRPVDMRHYGRARAQILRTIHHEAFHQYLSLVTAPLRPCVWFNEGHAKLFEASRLQRNHVVFDEQDAAVQRAAGLPLEQLFALDYTTFYSANEIQRQQHYATAWALVYYLRRTAATDAQFRFSGFLDAYLQELSRTKNGPAATRAVLAQYNLTALQDDFEDFWRSRRRRQAVMRAPGIAVR